MFFAAHAAVNALLVDAADTSALYLATSGFGVFKSSDSGATWVPFNNGLTYLDVTSLTIVHDPSTSRRSERRGPLSPGTLYAATPGPLERTAFDGCVLEPMARCGRSLNRTATAMA
jgi:hypothetical protein